MAAWLGESFPPLYTSNENAIERIRKYIGYFFMISLPCTGIGIYRPFHPRKPFFEIPAQDPESPHQTGECRVQKPGGGV